MSRHIAGSIGEALASANLQVEIDARNQSYAVALEVVKNVVGKYGSTAAKDVVQYWSEVSDLVFVKIKKDLNTIAGDK